MSKQRAYYPCETIKNLTFTTKQSGSPITPDTVTLKWKQTKAGSTQTATVSNPSTGVYTANIPIPNQNGNIHYQWSTTNPVIVEEGTIHVRKGKFTTATNRAYV